MVLSLQVESEACSPLPHFQPRNIRLWLHDHVYIQGVRIVMPESREIYPATFQALVIWCDIGVPNGSLG